MKFGIIYLGLCFIIGLLVKISIAKIYVVPLCKPYFRLPTRVSCQHYNIKISKPLIPNTEKYYWIEINYFIEARKNTTTINLHHKLETFILEQATRLLESSGKYIYSRPIYYTYCFQTQVLEITFPHTIKAGKYVLQMVVQSNTTADDVPGLASINYIEDGRNKILFTTNVKWAARRWFPCFDQPNIKATFNISVKHSRHYTVLSNMELRKLEIVDDVIYKDFVWSHFKTTPPIPAYLVGIAMFDSFNRTSTDVLINMWGRPQVFERLYVAYDFAVYCWNYILGLISPALNFRNISYVAIPSSSFLTGTMWRLYTYREEDLVYYQNSTVPHEKIAATRRVSTLAYSMFSDIARPDRWNFHLLNDGFARFFGLYMSEKFFQHSDEMDRFVVEDLQLALCKDVLSRVQPIMKRIVTPSQINSIFTSASNVLQKKATALVRALFRQLPNRVFEKAVSIYLQKHQTELANLTRFLTTIQEASNNDKPFDFEQVLNNWISTSNYPVLNVKRLSNDTIVLLQDHMYSNKKYLNISWWIPITFTTELRTNFSEPCTLWVNPMQVANIPHISDNWIIFNLQQTGYYRVNYYKENWERLAAYLQSHNYTMIHRINRAQLIDDSYHLMVAGFVSSDIFLDIIDYLPKERDDLPWYPMKRIVANMSIFFQFPESESVKYHIATIMTKALVYIGLEEHTNDTYSIIRLRILLAKLACELDQDLCLVAANNKLILYLNNIDKNILSPIWKDWVLCTGMKISSMSIWQKMVEEYNRTKEEQYLEYLNCAENPRVIIKYIDKLLSNEIQILGNKLWQIIDNILRKHGSKSIVLEYVFTNYDRIRKFNTSVPIIYTLIMNAYKEQQFVKLKEFVENYNFSEVELGTRTRTQYQNYLLSTIETRSDSIKIEVELFTSMFKNRSSTI